MEGLGVFELYFRLYGGVRLLGDVPYYGDDFYGYGCVSRFFCDCGKFYAPGSSDELLPPCNDACDAREKRDRLSSDKASTVSTMPDDVANPKVKHKVCNEVRK